MRFYFAYGSNMSVAQMRRRCPPARPVGTGRISGWRFIINSRGTASIVRAAGGEVQGVVWRVTRDCMATLDVFEGLVKGHYVKQAVRVETAHGRILAITYVARNASRGRPIRAYLEGTILPAARDWDLPAAYQQELAGWLGRFAHGPIRRPARARRWKPGGRP